MKLIKLLDEFGCVTFVNPWAVRNIIGLQDSFQSRVYYTDGSYTSVKLPLDDLVKLFTVEG